MKSIPRLAPQAISTGPRSRARGNGIPRIDFVTTDSTSRLRIRKPAKKISNNSFEISLGWKVKGPTRSHRRAPLIVAPMPGTAGSSRSRMPSSPAV